MIDLNKIEAAAKAATPGPWEVKPSNNEIVNMDHGLLPFAIAQGFTLIGALYEDGTDAAHIAAANPATVLEMVSMIRERDVVLRQAWSALGEARDLFTCVETCSRNNFVNLASEQVEDLQKAIAAIKGVLND